MNELHTFTPSLPSLLFLHLSWGGGRSSNCLLSVALLFMFLLSPSVVMYSIMSHFPVIFVSLAVFLPFLSLSIRVLFRLLTTMFVIQK